MLCHLLEDARSDKEARDNAEKVFNSIIDNLETKKTASYRPIKDGQAYVLDSVVLSMPSDVPSFKLVLREPLAHMGAKVSAGYSGKQRAIHVMMDLDTDWVSQLKATKSAIIHELIHHFDYVRSNGNIKDSSGKPIKQYYNDSSEVNAYYQEAMHEFEKLYSRIYANNPTAFQVLAKKLKNFEGFLDLVKASADANFVQNWTPETEKKFIKRVSGYYNDILLDDLAEKIREH